MFFLLLFVSGENLVITLVVVTVDGIESSYGNKKNICEITWKFTEKEIIQEQTDPNFSENSKGGEFPFFFILIYIQKGERRETKQEK